MPVLVTRLPWALLRGRRASPLALDAESVLRLRVRASDIDWWGHMNNGRYLVNMDLGRTDLIVRNGMWSAMQRAGWRPVMAGATIRFSRSLMPLRRYVMHTCLVGWDERSFYFDQRFVQNDRVMARAWARVVVTSPNGTVSAERCMEAAGWTGPPLKLPDDVAGWRELDRS